MKNLKSFFLGAIVCAVAATGCNKDNENPIISDASLSDATPNVGDTVTLTATISDVEGLAKIRVLELAGASTTGSEVFQADAEGGSYSLTYDYVVSANAADGEQVTLRIEATDDNKKEDLVNVVTEDVDFVVTYPAPTGNQLAHYSAVLMGAHNNATLGSFYSSSDNTVRLQADANSNSSLIDIIYYYGSTNFATLTAPDDATVNGGPGNLSLATGFTTKNATRFGSTTLDFAANNTDVNFGSLTFPQSKINSLAASTTYCFITAAGKMGLLWIEQINDDGAGDFAKGTIKIHVKVQQ